MPVRNVLLVYEMIPEETKIFRLSDVSDEDWEWMRLCHGYYVNYPMPPENEVACDKLSAYLEGKEPVFAAGSDEEPTSHEPLDVNPMAPSGRPVDYVVHTGFGM